MSINFATPELTELQPRITVMGVGGAGGNAVNTMIRSHLQGVEFIVTNTDAQALASSECDTRIQLGRTTTKGMGAGCLPARGQTAAEEALSEIEEHLTHTNMLFITAGMGGGTGTGAAPVIAKKAREMGILTVGVVTKPFGFEGTRRMRAAEAGLAALKDSVDTLIIIPNQNLFRVVTEKTTCADAFAIADDVLHSGVRGITDLMVMPGLINLDFADVHAIMTEMGQAMMGTGEAEGENRARHAAEVAVSNPLLDDVCLSGAKGVIINISGGDDVTLYEVEEAANHIRDLVDEDANIIVGSAFNESLNGQMRVSVVATGIETSTQSENDPQRDGRVVALRRPSARSDAMPVTRSSGGAATAAAVLATEDEQEDLAVHPDGKAQILAEPIVTPNPQNQEEASSDCLSTPDEEAVRAMAQADSEMISAPTQAPLDLGVKDAFVPAAPKPVKTYPTDQLAMPQQEDQQRVPAKAQNEDVQAIQPVPVEETPGQARARRLFKKLQDRITVHYDRETRSKASTNGAEPKDNGRSMEEQSQVPLFGTLRAEDRPAPQENDIRIPSFLWSQKN